ncbi:MAG: hypothetical protein FJ197_03680 [Gammaproteobacteria bacterium]|nr:hypothetical protein [Gammaproteobacteria bacterium]
MVSTGHLRSLPALACLVWLAAAPAQSPASGEACDIEIVVFRRTDIAGSTSERRNEPMRAAIDSTGNSWPELPLSSLQLGGAAAELRRGGGYTLLYHGGWRQPLLSGERVLPTALPQRLQESGLAGQITVYRERYLYGRVALQDQEGGVLRQQRRLRAGDLHYFDSPTVGLLLTVGPAAAVSAEP